MNIILADNSDIVRTRLRDLLSEIPGVTITAEVTSSQDAIAFARQLQPDLMFMNFPIPGGSGLETLRMIKEFPRPPRIIILTDNTSSEYQASCRLAGADHIFDKAIDIEKIQTLIQDLIQ